MKSVEFSVSDFVAVFNQTILYAYPDVTIIGELSNFRISKNRWVYFDLKDETASIRFFGSVYQLPGPLQDGMMLKVGGAPQLHPQFGFSITAQTIQPVGEGSIKKAADLLRTKLAAEGLFDAERKRNLPYPPASIGLITSGESAAYADFIKILRARWPDVDVRHYNVQVQGQEAPSQIVRAIGYFNSHAMPPEILVITRGGGSADDLQSFSTESVTRAVAASRIPTLVAIGHEVDLSLAELAADVRASTPSNAAELLVPDKQQELAQLQGTRVLALQTIEQIIKSHQEQLKNDRNTIERYLQSALAQATHELALHKSALEALSPRGILQRGYAVVRQNGKVVRSRKTVKSGEVTIEVQDGTFTAKTEV